MLRVALITLPQRSELTDKRYSALDLIIRTLPTPLTHLRILRGRETFEAFYKKLKYLEST